MDLRNHIRIALAYLFIVSLLGVILRHFQISDISINYKYTLHTHSHVALLGWIYTALTTLIYSLYLSTKSITREYRYLFWFTQITIIGMMITFWISGYSIASILFSTLFLFASYRFLYLFLKNTSAEQKNTTSYKWIRASLWFMVISSLGPWILGIIMNTLGSASAWYRNAIYFYLHFQYNGWFIMSIFGLFYKILEDQQIMKHRMMNPYIFRLFVSGVILTFFLSLLWMKPHFSFYILSIIGALFQIIAFGLIMKNIHKIRAEIRRGLSRRVGLLLKTVVILFSLKLIAQLLGGIPQFAEIIATNKDLIIGYLHWVFLGVATISIFAYLTHKGLMYIAKYKFFLFLIGFLLMEGLIFYKAFIVWSNRALVTNYYSLLFAVSLLLFISIGVILFQQKKNR